MLIGGLTRASTAVPLTFALAAPEWAPRGRGSRRSALPSWGLSNDAGHARSARMARDGPRSGRAGWVFFLFPSPGTLPESDHGGVLLGPLLRQIFQHSARGSGAGRCARSA